MAQPPSPPGEDDGGVDDFFFDPDIFIIRESVLRGTRLAGPRRDAPSPLRSHSRPRCPPTRRAATKSSRILSVPTKSASSAALLPRCGCCLDTRPSSPQPRLLRLPFHPAPPEQTDHDLTGQIVWPVAELLGWCAGPRRRPSLELIRSACRFVVHREDLFRGKKVVELGAGCGITGLVAARVGACVHAKPPLRKGSGKGGGIHAPPCLSPSPRERVALTDGNEIVLELLQKNAEKESARVETHTPPAGETRVECHELSWGEDESHAAFREAFGAPDVIIGADVVYWPSSVAPLVDTVKVRLAPAPRRATHPHPPHTARAPRSACSGRRLPLGRTPPRFTAATCAEPSKRRCAGASGRAGIPSPPLLDAATAARAREGRHRRRPPDRARGHQLLPP